VRLRRPQPARLERLVIPIAVSLLICADATEAMPS
jgi:hypothetical protein